MWLGSKVVRLDAKKLKNMKTFLEILNEEKILGIKSENMDIYQVYCYDQEGQLKKLIEYIGQNGNGGHSFDIVVDPDGDKDERKSFGWDGDGSDRIFKVEKIQSAKQN